MRSDSCPCSCSYSYLHSSPPSTVLLRGRVRVRIRARARARARARETSVEHGERRSTHELPVVRLDVDRPRASGRLRQLLLELGSQANRVLLFVRHLRVALTTAL